MTQRRRPRAAPKSGAAVPATAHAAANDAPAAVPAAPRQRPQMVVTEEMLAEWNAITVTAPQIKIALILVRALAKSAGGNLGMTVTAARDCLIALDLPPPKANAIALRALAITYCFTQPGFEKAFVFSDGAVLPSDQLVIAATMLPLEPNPVPADSPTIPIPKLLEAMRAVEEMPLPGTPPPQPKPPASPPAAKPEGEA